jgi:2-polyprenyl-3-methyl-5-hydroxy-6-metoxy-1,4-benzoquinol methylase
MLQTNDSMTVEHLPLAPSLGVDQIDRNRYLATLKVFTSTLPRGSVVLDVGCGIGQLSVAIKLLGYNVYAVDINLDKFGHRWKKHEIPVVRCDVQKESLPFIKGTFDCVICTELIEHLEPRTLHHFLGEIFRVLNVRGVLLLTTPNLASFQNRMRLLLGRRVIISDDHIREYVVEELLEALQKIGFSAFYKYLLSFDIPALTKKSNAQIAIARAFLYPLKLVIPRLRSLILILALKGR